MMVDSDTAMRWFDTFPRSVFLPLQPPARRSGTLSSRSLRFLALLLAAWAGSARANILWSDLGTTAVRETGPGSDILGGAVKRDDTSSDTLYLKFRVDPLSDATTEEYYAAFELFEGDTERLGVGNALKAWGYSAFVNVDDSGAMGPATSYLDLHSSRAERLGAADASTYELPRRGTERTFVIKIQYVPGNDDLVTVWLNPDLGPGANEIYQPESLTTRFSANASFDEIRLRHGGGGPGWSFSDMAIATSFNDFVDTSSAKPDGTTLNASPAAMPYQFRQWERDEGVPQSPIRALAQTRDGYYWLGSDDGLVRFDGVRFVPFDIPGTPHGTRVRALLGDRAGGLWVGTESNGLVHCENRSFTAYTVRDGLPSDSIESLAEDTGGRIWAGTALGLATVREGHIEPVAGGEIVSGKPVTALFKGRNGSLWVGATGAGVFEYRDGSFAAVTEPTMEALLLDPHCIHQDQEGRLWIGAGDDVVLCRDHDQWRRYRISHHTARPYISALAEESDGTLWAASVGEGLFQLKAGRLRPVHAGSGLSDNLVESLLVDRDGGLWAGTDSGLNLLRRKNLFIFGSEQGLGRGAVLGLAEVAPGVIWAAIPADGLYRWEGRAFSRLTAAGLTGRDPQVTALYAARDGSCWVACSRGVLRYKDPQAVADECLLSGLAGWTVLSLTEDAEGAIWAGTTRGVLWRLWAGQWIQQTNFAAGHPIVALLPDPDGSLWIGTDGGGLYRLKDGMVRAHYDKSAGLAGSAVRALALGSEGTLWIGTAGGGLAWLREGRLAGATAAQGLPDNTVSQILEDNAGRMWLGGNHGICCVARHDLFNLAAGKISAIYPQVYGRADGMLSEECSSGFSPAGLKTRSGALWFPTQKGIVAVDPQHQGARPAAAIVVLEEVRVDGVPAFESMLPGLPGIGAASGGDVLRVPPGKHRFELRYTGLGFSAPEQLRFRYRLGGWDSDWVEAGAQRTVSYNYVPPGDYYFRVVACDADGVWTENGAALRMVVARHFWQTWWAISGGVLGSLLLVGGGIRVVEKRRMLRRVRRLEQERALERERTRIAQDLHDEMGAKLCRISFLSAHARRGDNVPAELRDQIASISDASREVLHSLDEIVWAVNPHNDTLEHLASYIGQYAQDYFQQTGIECELDIPAQFPPHPLSSHVRHHLFLAVHEALTNMLKHSGATQTRVAMSCSHSIFEICASDNGAGFDPRLADPSGGPSPDSGNGLRNMRQRLADIGGSCSIDSKPGSGTTIHFVLPLNGHPPTT